MGKWWRSVKEDVKEDEGSDLMDWFKKKRKTIFKYFFQTGGSFFFFMQANGFLPFSTGYLIMTDDWFSEYVYEVVVDKKFLSDDVMQVMQQEPVVLPAWDPMGALA